jgi:hypothetical protein
VVPFAEKEDTTMDILARCLGITNVATKTSMKAHVSIPGQISDETSHHDMVIDVMDNRLISSHCYNTESTTPIGIHSHASYDQSQTATAAEAHWDTDIDKLGGPLCPRATK